MPQQPVQATEPPYTQFELDLHEAAEKIYTSGGTGYRWSAVDTFLAEHIPELTGETRCKSAPGSGRASNVLVESNNRDIELYLIFIGPNYSRQRFLRVARRGVSEFEKVKTVAIADKNSDGNWRVRSIVERNGVGFARQIAHHFPAVTKNDVHLVDATLDEATGETLEVDEEAFASVASDYKAATEGLADLVGVFRQFAESQAVQVDATTAVDLLASTLSSQLILFAGPSGTGKSTLARLLGRFFASEDRWRIVEARRQWLGPEELFGYYSVLAEYFASTPDTPVILDLHDSSVALLDEDAAEKPSPPVLVIEEINLSPIEGYLAPVIHGLSGVATPYVKWPLHGRTTGALDADGGADVPRTVLLGPFPRCFGTINVDATALAPAAKVAGRACVVLLEPSDAPSSADLAELSEMSLATEAEGASGGGGAAFLGDPRTGLSMTDSSEELRSALVAVLHSMSGAAPVWVSRRDLLRCLLYMAYFQFLVPKATLASDPAVLSAENAVLHFVLPTLPAERFAGAVSALLASESTAVASGSTEVIGGILRPRLNRLHQKLDSPLGLTDAIDYWASLS